MKLTPAVSALMLVVSSFDGRAEADPRAFSIGSQPAWFAMFGVTGGATLYDTRGGFVGGELSFARVREGRLIGLYADGYYDFGVDGTYVTAGLELGKKVGWVGLGIDGGGAVRFAYGDHQVGATGRLFVSAGVFDLYARYIYLTDTDRNDHVVQVGAALKFPLVSPW